MLVDIKNAVIKQDSQIILSNVNLSVAKGDFVFFVGKTGSGKTSLLSTLYGDLPFFGTSGNVLGFDLATLKLNKHHLLRKKIGFVFQDFQLLMDRNVFSNLAFVLEATAWKNPKDIEQRIYEVLDYVGVEHLTYAMPYELSRGQQQLVTIARALLNTPDLIIADEPTANLDPDTTANIIQIIYNLTTDLEDPKGVILATHQYQLLRLFDSTKNYLCENGEIYLTELDF